MPTCIGIVLAACVSLTLMGCAGGAKPEANSDEALRALRAHEWKLVAINGAPVSREVRPSINFDQERVTGSAGVNRMFGPYTAVPTSPHAGAIDFGALATTMMADDPEAMALEVAFLKALDNSQAFSLDESGRLTFTTRPGAVLLRFEASK